MAASPEPPQADVVRDAVAEQIDALAAQYQLATEVVDRLHGFADLVDWAEPNFVPKPDPSRRRRERRRPEVARHVASVTLADSLAGLELAPLTAARRVVDIGSGAGFPGLVLAIALPRARFTLIEKVDWKAAFLRRAVAELGLENVEVVQGPAQQWQEGLGVCDVVTARKVGRLETMVGWSAPFLAPGGVFALWPDLTDFAKGADAADDAADAADAAGLRLAQVHRLRSKNRDGEAVVKHLFVYQTADEG